MGLGEFFRKHLGKYFLNSPPVSNETEQRESVEGCEQSNKDSNPTSVPLDRRIAATSSHSNKSTDSKAESTLKIIYINRRAKEDPLLKSASKSSSKSSNSSTIKSAKSNQRQNQAGKQSTEEFSLITDTKSQLSHSSKQSKDSSKPNQLHKDFGISLSPANNVQPVESRTPDPFKSVLDNKTSLQVSGPQSSKNFVLASDISTNSRYSTKQDIEPKVNPSSIVTGITESVQAPFPSTHPDLVSENNREPKRAPNVEIPIHITAPEFRVNPNSTPKSKPKNVADSSPQSSQLAKPLTHAGQLKDMLSNSQHVPGSSHKLSELPYNSTSLRNYLESTSVRKSSLPRQVTSPNKNPVVSNRHSSISASPKPTSPRPLRPPEKNVTAVRGQSTSLRPSSSKKNSDIIVRKDIPKYAEECTHKNDEKIEETAEKSPGINPEDEISLVTLVEVSDSTKEVLEGAMKKFGMKEMTTEGYWNVRWSDNGVSIKVCQKLQKYQRINRFPVSGLLMTKNILAKNTTKMKQNFPEEYDFVPETWCLPGEMSKVEQYARVHDRDCFIVKPNDGSSGKGIIITRNIAKLKMCDKMVCQVYIRKPFLIDGYKFDLRIYTLITSCRPLRLFVYNEGLARFATEQYEEPNQQNESNRYMHLTNYAVNKRSPSYTVDETKGTLRRLTTINKWLVRHNVDAKKVWESMDDAIVKTIISFLPALRHNYRVSFPEQTDSNSCFQVLGFDIIFDENLKPYVLEVNDSPSFKADVPLDKEMTESLIHDTFNILHLYENNRSKVLIEEKRQSQLRLLSSSMRNKNAIEEKEQKERLLTQSRIEWENTHMGNYRKVFPNDQKMKHYKKFIRASQDIFLNHS